MNKINMKIFLQFEEARKYVHELNLKNSKEWIAYYKSERRPKNIPSNPRTVYKNNWISINDWLGNNPTKGQRQYNINDDYFKTWSHNMAYTLGFWWADGSIHINKGSFSFVLCQKDRLILDLILEDMECNPRPIRPFNNAYICRVASKTIVTDLISLGGSERKSLTTNFPKIPNEYLSDFIRGFFDGDGCIYFDDTLQKYKCKFTCGSKNFIYQLHDVLIKNIPDLGGSIETVNPLKIYPSSLKEGHIVPKNECYNLVFTASDTLKILNYIYQLPCKLKLERKHNLFIKSKITNTMVIKHYSYEEIKNLVKNKNIKSIEYLMQYRIDNNDYRIPCNMHFYRLQYKGADKFFDRFITYENAKKYVSELGLKGVREWMEWAKTTNRPPYINSNPQKYYKNNGWTSWADFLGNKKV